MVDLSKLWTPAPPTAYATILDNVAVGVGTLSLWESVPGAWNLLAMSYQDLPKLLTWAGPPEDFPMHLAVVPYCVGTALQLDAEFRTLGALTEVLTPQEFLRQVEPLKGQMILYRVFGEAWWSIANQFATEYCPRQTGNIFGLGAWRAAKHREKEVK